MRDPSIELVIGEIQAALTLAEDADHTALTMLIDQLERLRLELPRGLLDGVDLAVECCRQAAQSGGSLDALRQAVDELEQQLHLPFQQGEPCAEAEWDQAADTLSGSPLLVLPPHVEPNVLADFVWAQRRGMELLEQEIGALDGGDAEMLDTISSRLESLRAKADALGLADLAQVCRAMRNDLVAPRSRQQQVRRLTQVKEWISLALAAYGHLRLPRPPASAVLDLLT